MHVHTQPNTHTMSLSVLGCDRPMALARYVNYVCRAIHHPCTFPPETGTFVWSTHLLSPSFDSARPNLFPHSWVGGFISTYVLFFIFPSLWAHTAQTCWRKHGRVVTKRAIASYSLGTPVALIVCDQGWQINTAVKSSSRWGKGKIYGMMLAYGEADINFVCG